MFQLQDKFKKLYFHILSPTHTSLNFGKNLYTLKQLPIPSLIMQLVLYFPVFQLYRLKDIVFISSDRSNPSLLLIVLILFLHLLAPPFSNVSESFPTIFCFSVSIQCNNIAAFLKKCRFELFCLADLTGPLISLKFLILSQELQCYVCCSSHSNSSVVDTSMTASN